MFVVIADDFTGAAEIGGIGLRYGLRVELRTEPVDVLDTDLLVIDSNTRSSSEADANRKGKMIFNDIQMLNPDLLYKKTDSVLRGNILAELSALEQIYKDKKILLVAPNPSLGRFIVNGKYYIKGQPIQDSGFIDDPEHPIKSSLVLNMLKSSQRVKVQIHLHSHILPVKGIIIGEVSSIVDLKKWAERIDDSIIPAGGADFFAAILEQHGYRRKNYMIKSSAEDQGKHLFVLGSGSEASRKFVKESIGLDRAVSLMPRELCASGEPNMSAFERWIKHVLDLYKERSVVLIAISGTSVHDPALAKQLRKNMALLVEKVVEKIRVSVLYIEGGATASSVMNQLKWHSFTPSHEYSSGVVKMRVAHRSALTIVVKPGSYPWPKEIINQI